MNYRADIDGLRAIAVLSVVLFHLEVPGFQTGYVGVDIFFVISGYLITSIIKTKYEDNTFSLSDFYIRRIRRLIPPLIATVAITFLGAAYIMTPSDMVAFSRSASAALFSLSNIVFYSEAGYWDTASELKPLLHTWSLSVEEQFYLFWPALIIGLLSIRRTISFGASLALISIFGAILCIWYTGIDQSAAFYLLPFRVFQFAVGALLIPLTSTLQQSTKISRYIRPSLAFWSGTLLVLISVIGLDRDTVFPGWAVLLPTLGSALMLLGGAMSGQLHTRALVQNGVSTWLGRVSYSMYLVHWPIIVLFRYQFGIELTVTDQLILAVSTLVATCALHYGIERRFYQRNRSGADTLTTVSGNRLAFRSVLVAGLLALIASSAWWTGGGWAWRFPTLSLSAEQIAQGYKDRSKKYDLACSLENLEANQACDLDAKFQVLVLGNSHEPDAYNFFSAGYGDDKDINLVAFGYPNPCLPLKQKTGPFPTEDEQCNARINALFDPALLANLDVVLYAANRPYSKTKYSFLTVLQQLKRLNPEIKIVTYGGYINTKRPCAYYINKTNTTQSCVLSENVSYFSDDEGSKVLLGEFKEIESYYIDRVDLLCESRLLNTCRTRTDDGIPALYDKTHISFEFAEMSGRMYAKKHPNLIRELTLP